MHAARKEQVFLLALPARHCQQGTLCWGVRPPFVHSQRRKTPQHPHGNHDARDGGSAQRLHCLGGLQQNMCGRLPQLCQPTPSCCRPPARLCPLQVHALPAPPCQPMVSRRPAAAAAHPAACLPPCCLPRRAAVFGGVTSSSSNSSISSSRARWPAAAAAARAVPEAAAELEPAEQEQWGVCVELLEQRCGLTPAAADTCLLRAFGWKGQGFWRQERVQDVPCPDQIAAALDFLAGLGLAEGEEQGKVVSTFPEVLGLRVEVMQGNAAVLRDKWSMKGNVLVNAVKRKPKVLGNIIDCEVGAGRAGLRRRRCILRLMRLYKCDAHPPCTHPTACCHAFASCRATAQACARVAGRNSEPCHWSLWKTAKLLLVIFAI